MSGRIKKLMNVLKGLKQAKSDRKEATRLESLKSQVADYRISVSSNFDGLCFAAMNPMNHFEIQRIKIPMISIFQ